MAGAGLGAWYGWGQFAGRDWTPWTSHIRLSMLVALGMIWGRSTDHGGWRTWDCRSSSPVTGSFTSALLLPLL